MYQLSKHEKDKIVPLFKDWNETLIWSCLQGYMGNAWVNNNTKPTSAQIIVGDFCFFAGVPDAELVNNIPESFVSDFILMVPRSEAWEALIEEEYRNTLNKFMRYAIKKEPEVFDREKLKRNILQLSPEYKLKQIDEELYLKCRSEEWSKDLCSQFPTYDDYKKLGVGYVILHDDKPVSGASSYTVYEKGIEIEIDTKEDYRRRGLALVCASKLILECLERNLYPSWDAANKASVALAEKLGYHFEEEYVTYSIPVKAGGKD